MSQHDHNPSEHSDACPLCMQEAYAELGEEVVKILRKRLERGGDGWVRPGDVARLVDHGMIEAHARMLGLLNDRAEGS